MTRRSCPGPAWVWPSRATAKPRKTCSSAPMSPCMWPSHEASRGTSSSRPTCATPPLSGPRSAPTSNGRSSAASCPWLPAHLRVVGRVAAWIRGAAALAPPQPGRPGARPVDPAGRGKRDDHRHRPLGAADRMPAGGRMAAHERPRPLHRGQRLGPAAPGPGVRRRDRRGPAGGSAAARSPRPRDHRECHGRRPRGGDRAARVAPHPRRRAVHRRLRDRATPLSATSAAIPSST